jgi:hypothetical protein
LLFGAAFSPGGGLPGTEHIFFEPLIEPSLQTNLSAAQWEMPPLRPEQGLLAAPATPATARMALTKAKRKKIVTRHSSRYSLFF